jgi:hypothetical protein
MFATRIASVLPRKHLSSRFGAKRCLSFTFAGPRTLEEILKKDLVQDKSATEVADLWYTYHENKVRQCTLYTVPI